MFRGGKDSMREKIVVKDNKTTHRLINSDFFARVDHIPLIWYNQF
ncbi:hypothetical protein AXI76_gp104 [Pseudoalteromonas phage H101]|uniref:Uncharacterized protein n=1 Tax=Pseudoalteromonas phage H101 TaxID=1654919 RepID=A0A0H4J260_9CAUD|nr:hypothetical protein AXI76_gp104 [Pseudoalteromonas phage H101]AKO61005.1 hypothetical protein [Pseudoalteromonas phage H101]